MTLPGFCFMKPVSIFYKFSKIHKKKFPPPGRSIVSGTGSLLKSLLAIISQSKYGTYINQYSDYFSVVS